MSARSFPLPSPLKVEEQGIVTILGSDFNLNKVASSLRRTLSADMPSKKWLTQNGISPMKRIASSEELAIPVSDHGEEKIEKPTEPVNVSWSSIIQAEKTNDDSNENVPPPPPYIHPLVKKSANALSEKSLEICTESLGSETGSDGFSSSEASDIEEGDKDDEEDAPQIQQQQQQQDNDAFVESIEEFPVVKYNYNPCKKLLPKAFPPPLPSIASRDGASLHMQSHRKNGRLVLEAVSMPQRNYFHAERQQGRLLLSLVPTSQNPRAEEDIQEDKVEEFDEVFGNFDEVEKNEATEEEEEEATEEEEEEDKDEELAFAMEKSSSLPITNNVNKSGLMMKRLIRVNNNDPTWSNKLNKAVNLMEVNEVVDGLTPFPQSLPPPATVARLIPSPSPPATRDAAAAASFNVYEYFWRKQPTVANVIDPVTQQGKKNSYVKAYEQQELVVMRGNKAGHLVPMLRGCKESRRSLLIWEPHCIATS